MSEAYVPPYVLTDAIIAHIADIGELVGSLMALARPSGNPKLRRENRIRTIQASLAIENNSLSVDQVSDIIDGKRVVGAVHEILEVKNAFGAYERLMDFDPYRIEDLLAAHRILMAGLVPEAGAFRSGGVGVFAGDRLVHMAPPASRVPELVEQLLAWTRHADAHPLIKSCVFHYEFEFIHPFADGNGRMGRMWQTLLLQRWKPIFAWLPVETLIKERQDEYYGVLAQCDRAAESGAFVEFMMRALLDALRGAVEEVADLGMAHDVDAQGRGAEVVLDGSNDQVERANDQVESTDAQVDAQVDRANDQVESIDEDMRDRLRALMSVLGDETLAGRDIMARLGIRSRRTLRVAYLHPAMACGLVEMTNPDAPNSSRQRYRRAR